MQENRARYDRRKLRYPSAQTSLPLQGQCFLLEYSDYPTGLNVCAVEQIYKSFAETP